MGYRAFFSYARADDRVANWLHRQLDSYRTPKVLVGGTGELGPVPSKLHPIFRDRTDLEAGGHIDQSLQQALEDSDTLIVLCTPTSAKSKWVNHECETFLKLGREARVFPVIAAGEPDSGDPDTECFPQALRGKGLLAADLREIRLPTGALIGDGRDGGRLKLIAGLLGVPLDALARRERRRQRMLIGGLALATVVFAVVAGIAAIQTTIADRRASELRGQLGTTAHVLSRDERYLVDSLRIAMQAVGDNDNARDIPADVLRGLRSVIFRMSELQPVWTDNSDYFSYASGTDFLAYDRGHFERWRYNGDTFTILNTALPERFHRNTANSPIAASQDGSRVLFVGSDLMVRSVQVVDLTTGQVALELSYENYLTDSPPDSGYASWRFGPNIRGALNSDGTLVAITSRAALTRRDFETESGRISDLGSGQVDFWTVGHERPIATITPTRTIVTTLALSNSGTILAVGDAEGVVTLWSAPLGQLLAEARRRPRPGVGQTYNPITALQFMNRDGVLLAAAGDGRVEMYDVHAIRPTLTTLARFQVSEDMGDATIEIAPCDGIDRFVTLQQGTAMLWRWDEVVHGSVGPEVWHRAPGALRERSRLLSETASVQDVSCAPDGSFVVIAEGDRVSIWDPRSGTPLRDRRFEDHGLRHVSFVQAGSSIAVIVGGNEAGYVWTLQDNGFLRTRWGIPELIETAQRESPIFSVGPQGEISPQGDISFAARNGSNGVFVFGTTYGARRVYSPALEALAPLRLYGPASMYSDLAAVSASEGRVAWISQGATSVMDASTGDILWSIPESGTAIAISDDGRMLALADAGGPVSISGGSPEERSQALDRHFHSGRRILIFDLSSTTPVRVLDGAEGQINALRFSRDGRGLFSASLDRTVRHWPDWRRDAYDTFTHPSEVGALSVECDALLTSDGTVRIWEVSDRRVIREFGDGQNPVFSHDCSMIAATRDDSVVVWNVRTGEMISSFIPHNEQPVFFVSFVDDDTHLVTLGDDGVVKRFPLAGASWIRQGRRLLSHYAD